MYIASIARVRLNRVFPMIVIRSHPLSIDNSVEGEVIWHSDIMFSSDYETIKKWCVNVTHALTPKKIGKSIFIDSVNCVNLYGCADDGPGFFDVFGEDW